MNTFMKQKQTHRYGEQTCGCQGGGGVGEERIGIWGLADVNLYIEWIITRSYYIAQETIFNIL